MPEFAHAGHDRGCVQALALAVPGQPAAGLPVGDGVHVAVKYVVDPDGDRGSVAGKFDGVPHVHEVHTFLSTNVPVAPSYAFCIIGHDPDGLSVVTTMSPPVGSGHETADPSGV